MLDDRTPDAPGLRQGGKPELGTGGCEPSNTSAYVCTIAREAPIYQAGTRKRYTTVPAGHYPSLCQSAGSKYSFENRANYWWAWVRVRVPFFEFEGWVPVVFLKGGPDNGPEPGLPVCDSASTSTTTTRSAPTSTGSAPTTTTTPAR
jgi:hypothetical protein